VHLGDVRVVAAQKGEKGGAILRHGFIPKLDLAAEIIATNSVRAEGPGEDGATVIAVPTVMRTKREAPEVTTRELNVAHLVSFLARIDGYGIYSVLRFRRRNG
jgi:hypothetical protein